MALNTSPLRLTPLYAAGQRRAAKFVELAHWRVAQVYSTTPAEIAAVRAGCGLADASPHGKLQVEGSNARESIRSALGAAPQLIGAHAQFDQGHIYRLRQDQFYISTAPGLEREVQGALEEKILTQNSFVTVTDLTHGLADIRILGPASAQVLSSLCGLDFDSTAFPNLTARQSSLAKTRQLILRRDFGSLHAYEIIGARSLGAYLWDALLEAGSEFGIAPVGIGALQVLEQGAAE